MADRIIYLKMDTKVKTAKEWINIGDLGKLYCQDAELAEEIKKLHIYRFRPKDQGRCVIGVLKVVELVEQHYPDCLVQVIGETETIVEEMTGKPSPGWLVNIKVGFVALLCFFGTMYTIMSYHCDVNINMLFGQIYAMVMGRESDGYTVMEAAYSVGLSLGIILFYNHVGKRRLTPDPSPVEVEMRTYEEDVNRSVVETANREERTLDVP